MKTENKTPEKVNMNKSNGLKTETGQLSSNKAPAATRDQTQYKFDRDIHIEALGPGVFKTVISGDWNIAAPNGGYLMSIIGNAMSRMSEFDQPLSFSVYYNKPMKTAEAEIQVEDIVTNRRLHTMRAQVIQNGGEIMSCIASFTKAGSFKGSSLQSKRPQLPKPSDCQPIPGSFFSFFNQVTVSLPEEQRLWQISGQGGHPPQFSGYMEFADGRPLDGLSTLLFADATPPPILRHTGPLAWVPTIELSVQVRRAPRGHRLGFISSTSFATNGLTETDVELYDEDGEIVALSRQLAVMKERKKRTSSKE